MVSGPSGSGKTTLAEAVVRVPGLKGVVRRSISCTTRPRRRGEREGRDYFFLTEAQFMRLRSDKKILEWTRYLGYYYGTPKRFVDEQLAHGAHLIMCLDLRGACRLKRLYPRQAVKVFVTPPSLAVLRTRIKMRSPSTSEEEVCRRLRRAKDELAAAGGYDYRVRNDVLRRAVERFAGIINKVVRC